MCAICGEVRAGGASRSRLEAMRDAMTHRGPDDSGAYIQGEAALGHRRLSIIDLGGGHQPIGNEDDSIQVVLNGEIYNYRELREELVAQGHTFRTHSDTEVLVHLYEQHGPDCVNRLRGMFAFAIWDGGRKRLFAARDHFGQKPFYYTTGPNHFAFASEIKGLLAGDSSLSEMDPEALDEYLALRIITPPRSMFRKIRKLPPAHSLLYDLRDGLRITRYWDLEFEPKASGSETQLIDNLEEELIDSLRVHMVSDVPVGSFLSGGYDSSLVVSMLMKHVLKEPLDTFAGSVRYRDYDEAPFAKMVADAAGTRHHELEIHPSLAKLLPTLIHQVDEPSDSLMVCSYLISQLAREHVKVVLGGDGGDELFGGYDRYYGNKYAGLYARVPAVLRRHLIGNVLRLVPDGGWYKSPGHQAKWLHQLSFLDGGERYASSLGYFYFDAEARERLYGDAGRSATAHSDPYRSIREAYERAPASDPIDRMLYADSQLRMTDHPVMTTDRMTMAHGLEARSPFLDHRLASFCARLPAEMKVRGRTLRWVQVRLAERYLPEAVVNKPKQGFQSALPYLLENEYRLLFRLFLKDAHLARDGIFRQAELDRVLGEHEGKQADHANRLWLLLSSEVWYRMYSEGTSREDLGGEIAEAQAAGVGSPAAAA